MHIAEGILTAPVWGSAAVAAAALVAVGLRRLDDARVPSAALFGAAFFVASTVHLPVGPTSMHLLLTGLLGLVLGWSVFPVVAAVLLLQALLFGFGGLVVLGANVLTVSVPAVTVHLLLRRHLRPGASRRQVTAVGAAAGALGVMGSAALAGGLLWASGGGLAEGLVWAVLAAHLPLAVLEAVVTATTLGLLASLAPALLAAAPGEAPHAPQIPRSGHAVDARP